MAVKQTSMSSMYKQEDMNTRYKIVRNKNFTYIN